MQDPRPAMSNRRIDFDPQQSYSLTWAIAWEYRERILLGSIVSACRFEDRAPVCAQLTSYDEGHLLDYLHLLDADAEGADWREAAGLIFGIDAAAEPDRAKVMHDSHLARARWMTEVGYAHLLGSDRPLRS